VATVGKRGEPGEHVRCVVSVAMLTEGWDANNVTHVLGVRAFRLGGSSTTPPEDVNLIFAIHIALPTGGNSLGVHKYATTNKASQVASIEAKPSQIAGTRPKA